MGKRGPKPSEDGLKRTPKGYVRRYDAQHGRSRMEHVIVWERHNGAVPDGYQVHHRNGAKDDNRIENLELLTALEHKRFHSGYYRDSEGQWIKPCRTCGEHKRVETEYYRRKDGVSAACRKCSIARSIRDKQERKARQCT